jgi:SPP1 gp7 family putative phage head morphogenesis protein
VEKSAKIVMTEAVKNQISYNDTMVQMDSALQQWDVVLSGSVLETVCWTNIMSAWNEARLQQFEQLTDDIVAYEYSAILDETTTDLCRELDGNFYSPANANLINPPNHMNCRSLLLPIYKDETGEGGELEGIEINPSAPVKRTEGNFLELVK